MTREAQVTPEGQITAQRNDHTGQTSDIGAEKN